MNFKTLLIFVSLILAFTLLASGCLKTRTQVHSNDADNSSGEETESVEPRGDGSHGPSQNYALEEMRNEVIRLNGRIEELTVAQQKNPAEANEEALRMQRRIEELEKNQLLLLTELKTLKEEKVAVPKQPSVAPKELFAEGQKLLKEKQYETAAQKFQEFISKNPSSPDLHAAYFNLGEAEYATKNYKKAIVTYSKVQEVSSKSPHVAVSLYRIGLCFEKLNMKKEAKGFFSEVAERYPKTIEGRKAKIHLK